MANILITGGCGFIGSNLAILLRQKHSSYKIYCLDNLKRRGSELNINRLKDAGIQFIHGDIRNKEDLNFEFDLDYIIDAAAEPSVLAGLGSTFNYVINTNLVGTLNILELAAQKKAKFIFLSTSRIYPIEHLENIQLIEGKARFEISEKQKIKGITTRGINEEFPLNKARSIYGSTKLASELFIEEFREFYGVDYVINRCGVVAGPYQMGKVDQGVVTLWMARHYWNREVKYIGYNGTGKQVRDVLHIQDLFELIEKEIQNFDIVKGQTFNAGGGIKSSVSLKELTVLCKEITENKISELKSEETRKGDIPLYVTDNSKIKTVLGWEPQRNVKDVLVDIYKWMNKNDRFLKPILDI